MMEPTGTSMARPFENQPRLSIPFPSPDELRGALAGASQSERGTFARLWLSEGFPAAFCECPAVYEHLRDWLGRCLKVHPKEITLIGSARIGYSLAPVPDFGRPFNDKADLDLSVISNSLFDRLASTFSAFTNDCMTGVVVPRHASEE